jgi:alcohol dehydrogenase (cytochrome c)
MRQYVTEELAPELAIETTPLVVGDYMFVTGPHNQVEALDARTGALLWRYRRNLPEDLRLCCGYVNRGLAVQGSSLFLGTLDAHLVALDLLTGQVKWDAEVADYRMGYSITAAPLSLKNMVVTGVAGGEFGIRGLVDAYELESGRRLWRFNTIPQPGDPGSNSWAGESWRTGGGPTWMTGSYDPQLNSLYWAVGHPAPNYDGDSRLGDNLYTNSVVALDPDRGTLKWYFQFMPHDEFDWDAVQILVLLDANVNGEGRRLLAQANRNAFYYVLDRVNGELILARPFAKQNWAQQANDASRPVRMRSVRPTPRGTVVYPWVGGGTNWQSPSYNPETKSMYIPVTDIGGVFFTSESKYRPGDLFLGGAQQVLSGAMRKVGIRSIDALTGDLRWESLIMGADISASVGGLLSTRGGVVFAGLGESFLGLDATTGKELWRVDLGGRVKAAPITFMSAGKQLVTVAAGRNILTFGLSEAP